MPRPPDPPPHRRLLRIELGRHRVARDVDVELEFHLDMRIRRLIERGMAPAAARAEALRQFGDVSAVRAECLAIDYGKERAVSRANYLAELRRDAAYALRALRQNAAFAMVVVSSLAVAIGANAAIFTLVNALLLRPLPVPAAGELVAIGDPRRLNGLSSGTPTTEFLSYPLYKDVRDRNTFVTALAAAGRTGRLDAVVDEGPSGASSAGEGHGGDPERVRGRHVTGNYFAVMRVPAFIGRTLTAADDAMPNGTPVVVLSHAYWQRRFGGDRGVLGRTVRLNRSPFTIVGVAAKGFDGEIVGQTTEMWLPLTTQPAINHGRSWLGDRNTSWLIAVGRLEPGVTLEQAKAGFTALVHQSIAAAAPDSRIARAPRDFPVVVTSAARGISRLREQFSEPLAALMVAAGLVLLVVCANVANLLLARGAARAREMSVRMAVGAGRLRVVRQLLTESIIISAFGGLGGLVLAYWGSRLLLRLASDGPQPVPLDTSLDWRVLAFSGALTLITAVLFGLVPAVRATRVELAATLRSQTRGVTGGLLGAPGRLGIGRLLVIAQVALALTLLVGTSLLVRSTQALATVDAGLDRDHLLIVTVDATALGTGDEQRTSVAKTLHARLGALPGVASVSYSENGIFAGTESMTTFQVDGFVARTDADTSAFYDRVGPDYFSAIGAKVLQGRDIRASDHERAPRVAVINRTMASFYFPNGDALGRHIRIDTVSHEIVGVVADTKDHEVRQHDARRVYLPMHQSGRFPFQFTYEVRASGDPAQLVTPVRRAVAGTNPLLTLYNNDPLALLMRASITRDRLVARVASFFGMLSLALAALGLYGVMMYATLRRTSEFGLRMALGAGPRTVARMVLGEAIRLVAAGAVIGLPLAAASTRLLRNQLFGVDVMDIPSFVLAVTVLGLSAAVAGYLPANRAARVGPLEALRSE